MGDDGVPKDPDRAEAFLKKACQLEEKEACAYLEKHGDALEREQQPERTEAEGESDDSPSEGASTE